MPNDAEVFIYDADADDLMPVTGCIYGWEPGRDTSRFVVELTSDDIS